MFESIKKGLEEAIEYSQGGKIPVKVYQPKSVDSKSIWQQTQLTQQEFATTFGISSIATLRHWERGDRQTHGAALVLLNLVKKAPDTVLRILHE